MDLKLPKTRNPKVISEMQDAFDSVEIVIKAKIGRLCNEGRYVEAARLENALNLISETDFSI